MQPQNGVSLVELMISMLLGLIITAGVIAVYLTNVKNYQLSEAQTQIHETSFFTRQFMTEALQNVDFSYGCPDDLQLANTVRIGGAQSYPSTLKGGLQGFEVAGEDQALSANFAALGIADDFFAANSDVLMVASLELLEGVKVQAIQSAIASELDVSTQQSLPVGLYSLVSPDCQNAAQFVVTGSVLVEEGVRLTHAVAETGLGLWQDFNNCVVMLKGGFDCGSVGLDDANFTAQAGDQLFHTRKYAYGLRQLASSPAGVLSLVRIDLHGELTNQEELVTGIKALQIEYGVSPVDEKHVEHYLKASDVLDWSSVKTVRLLLELVPSKQSGATNDMSETIEQIISIRNRIVQ